MCCLKKERKKKRKEKDDDHKTISLLPSKFTELYEAKNNCEPLFPAALASIWEMLLITITKK